MRKAPQKYTGEHNNQEICHSVQYFDYTGRDVVVLILREYSNNYIFTCHCLGTLSKISKTLQIDIQGFSFTLFMKSF